MVEHQRHLQWTIRHPDQNSNLNHYQYIQTDPQWKNSSSKIFLEYARDEIKQLNGKIINVDLTIICEKPKINNFRDQMQKNIAKVLDISIKQVNIKATTTERLGFVGREEGIAAQAIAGVQI